MLDETNAKRISQVDLFLDEDEVECDLDVMTRELGVWSQRAGESKVNGERSSVPPPVAARSAGEQLANADDAAGLPARLRALG